MRDLEVYRNWEVGMRKRENWKVRRKISESSRLKAQSSKQIGYDERNALSF
jgi:hypothetical protein